MPRGRSPAPKRHNVKVLNGTYSRVLGMAEQLRRDPDELGDELLNEALDRRGMQAEREHRETRWREADHQAKAKGLPTVPRRDFGLRD